MDLLLTIGTQILNGLNNLELNYKYSILLGDFVNFLDDLDNIDTI